MIPVTTKPFLDRVNFSLPKQVFLHFFSLLEEKTNRHVTFCKRSYGMRCHVNHSDTSYFNDYSTNASNFTSFVFSESQYKLRRIL